MSSTIVVERGQGLYLTNRATVVRTAEDLCTEYAEAVDWAGAVEQGSPFVTWISGAYAESDRPNDNTQFWTADDLAFGEYSIQFSPLNIVHRKREPVGFFLRTRRVYQDHDQAFDQAGRGPFRIDALAGMWSHLFPFETRMVETADRNNSLWISMECRAEKVRCAGDSGCGQTFDYQDVATHCAHLHDRASVRHLIRPTFRGGALIIPPTKPGWTGAKATVQRKAVMDEASRYAEMTEAQYEEAKRDGYELTPATWESLMASIVSLAGD